MSMAESQSRSKDLTLIVVMGVSGCGKSSVGAALANSLSLPFMDADDYHPASNVQKMSNGIPLDDDDRWPWFEKLSSEMSHQSELKGGVVCGCSALKRSYRDFLTAKLPGKVLFVYLHGDRELLVERMQARENHYMPVSLLDSQLATLESPTDDENAITISIDQPVDTIVSSIKDALES